MTLSVSCPRCGTSFGLPAKLRGKRVRCKGCGGAFLVEATSESQEDVPDTTRDGQPTQKVTDAVDGPRTRPERPAPQKRRTGAADLPPRPQKRRDAAAKSGLLPILGIVGGVAVALFALVLVTGAIAAVWLLRPHKEPAPSDAVAAKDKPTDNSSPSGSTKQPPPHREQDQPAKPPAPDPELNRPPPDRPFKELTFTGGDQHDFVYAVAFSPDGKTVAYGTRSNVRGPDNAQVVSGTVALWDVAARKHKGKLAGHAHFVQCLAFSPDGGTLASGSADGMVKLWDVAGEKELVTLAGHTGAINALLYSNDGKTLVTASADKSIRLWDTDTHKHKATLSGHAHPISCLALTADGRTLASGGKGPDVRGWEIIKLWDLATGQERGTLGGTSTWMVQALSFTPDGKTLVAGYGSGEVKWWDLATGKVLANVKAHGSQVNSLWVTADGKAMITGGWDGAVKVLDAATGNSLAVLTENPDHLVNRVAVTPDGKRAAAAVGVNTVKVWDVSKFTKPDR
jgi:WD40 repeat protein